MAISREYYTESEKVQKYYSDRRIASYRYFAAERNAHSPRVHLYTSVAHCPNPLMPIFTG